MSGSCPGLEVLMPLDDKRPARRPTGFLIKNDRRLRFSCRGPCPSGIGVATLSNVIG